MTSKLSKTSKQKLRNFIEKNLEDVPEGEKIHIDKDILESLIFEQDSDAYNAYLGVKVPVWTGEFLSKIDLCEISFAGVNFNSYLSGYKPAVFVDTNAVINLDDLYNPGVVNYVNFSGTKVTGCLRESYQAILVNCGLTAKNFKFYCQGNSSNFEQNDLYGLVIQHPEQIFTDEIRNYNSFFGTGALISKNVFDFVEHQYKYGVIDFDRYNSFFTKYIEMSDESCLNQETLKDLSVLEETKFSITKQIKQMKKMYV